MVFQKLLMDFTNVRKYEKSAEFRYGGKSYMVNIGVNPWNDNVLFSLYLDRDKVIENRVCVNGEFLLGGFGDESFTSDIEFDFVFLYSKDEDNDGAIVDPDYLGNKIFMYVVKKEELGLVN
ncbi:MAG: hypothetical protein ACRCX2_12675 [Paraclostridium sp.]